jgi:hypothetical protein
MADDTFQRILAEVEAQGHSLKWLAAELGIGPEAVMMWRSRGKVPASQLAHVAVALGQSIEWALGKAERSPARPLSPMALRIAREFDRITDPERQLDALASCLTAIGRASGSGLERP